MTGCAIVTGSSSGIGRALPEIDRVFPAAEAAEAFDYLVKPGKSGKVLLDFG
jgi:NADPH:quinone reductase-like Zn-dependent oxidoreductase